MEKIIPYNFLLNVQIFIQNFFQKLIFLCKFIVVDVLQQGLAIKNYLIDY